MNIGELNRRIKILRFVETHDEYGGIGGDWKPILTRWAKIENSGGNENFVNDQVQATKGVTITIRYCPTIQEIDRIQYKEKIYEIESIADKDSGHYKTILTCKELIENGV